MRSTQEKRHAFCRDMDRSFVEKCRRGAENGNDEWEGDCHCEMKESYAGRREGNVGGVRTLVMQDTMMRRAKSA